MLMVFLIWCITFNIHFQIKTSTLYLHDNLHMCQVYKKIYILYILFFFCGSIFITLSIKIMHSGWAFNVYLCGLLIGNLIDLFLKLLDLCLCVGLVVCNSIHNFLYKKYNEHPANGLYMKFYKCNSYTDGSDLTHILTQYV